MKRLLPISIGMFTIMQADMNEKIESLLSEMTLEEKVALTAGNTFWTTVPLARLGIPVVFRNSIRGSPKCATRPSGGNHE